MHKNAAVIQQWNKSAEGAIDQILKRKYPSVFEDYGCPILLVGITYDKDARAGKKRHKCRIIEYNF